jgi:hypothetical protein
MTPYNYPLLFPPHSPNLHHIKIPNALKKSNRSGQILHLAMTHFEEATSWQAVWKMAQNGENTNRMLLTGPQQKLDLAFEVRSNVQEAQLEKLIEKKRQHDSFLIIAGRISQPVKDQLKKQHIHYIDSGGNACIQTDTVFLLIEGRKSSFSPRRKHLFTNASIQLLFHLFREPELLQKTYRDIAKATGGSLDNISKTIRTLQEHKYILPLEKKGYAFSNKKKVIERWIPEYGERLKPSLLTGRYSFLPEVNWKFLQIDTSLTRWGGEPAAEKIFGHVQPSTFTLYSQESHQDLIRNYRLLPDPEGNIFVYQTFWDMEKEEKRDVVPQLLVYTDLILSNNKRNLALAKQLL